jgi:hypothetical protein
MDGSADMTTGSKRQFAPPAQTTPWTRAAAVQKSAGAMHPHTVGQSGNPAAARVGAIPPQPGPGGQNRPAGHQGFTPSGRPAAAVQQRPAASHPVPPPAAGSAPAAGPVVRSAGRLTAPAQPVPPFRVPPRPGILPPAPPQTTARAAGFQQNSNPTQRNAVASVQTRLNTMALQMTAGKGKGGKKGKGKAGKKVLKAPTAGERREQRVKAIGEIIQIRLVDIYLTKMKQIHSSELFAGKTGMEVERTKMSDERSIVRHLSTALLAQLPDMTEVQAAISHADKAIYVASNSKQSGLTKLISGTVSTLKVPDPTDFGIREKRHTRKLETEKAGAYKDYKIEQVTGLEGQHAETKIVDAGKSFDYIGGTRRPCTACSLYFGARGVDQSKFNPHHGAYWNSKMALKSFGTVKTDLGKKVDQEITKRAKQLAVFYFNKSISAKQKYDYDTDSDTD